jgi:CheY-like chemotaxis protein
MVIDDSHGLPLPPGKYVHISLADEGTGIPKKYLVKVFDPYFSTKQEGSGLGLAVCHSIINNHDGHMTVESEYGNGTTFHIYLPASQRKPEAKAVLTEESRRSGEKILIMDDDENILTVAVNMLNLMGYKTETARDGTEAISLYKQAMLDEQMFDGVLLDLTIPGGMGGRETLQQLATIDPEIKAIVSSGYTNDPIMTDYQAHGFRGAVTKPYNMQQLGQALRDLFN